MKIIICDKCEKPVENINGRLPLDAERVHPIYRNNIVDYNLGYKHFCLICLDAMLKAKEGANPCR